MTAAGATEPKALQMRLVVEEIATSIGRRAWPEGVDGHLHVEMPAEDGAGGLRVVMTTIDDGVAFVLTAKAAPDINADLDDRTIGSLGMFLVREMEDTQRHPRTDGVIDTALVA